MDHALSIRRVLEGDDRAFGGIVREYQHMVYTVCHRVLRNADDAEEATQDAFVKAYQHLRGFSGSSKFSTWLFSIAYRTAVSHQRRRRTDGGSVDDLTLHPAAEPEAGAAPDVQDALQRGLAQLAPEDAAILSFYYLEDLSVEEIVTITGLGASNVKVKLHRSRKKLAEAMERQLGSEARALLLNDA